MVDRVSDPALAEPHLAPSAAADGLQQKSFLVTFLITFVLVRRKKFVFMVSKIRVDS